MAKKILTEEVKRFIVRCLAIYESPSDVAALVKERFGLTITRQTAHLYDPTKIAGQELSDELKTLFFETRKKFEEEEILPLSKKIVRIKKLSKYVENFENLQNYKAAAELLEQIAKEQGDAYTNRFKVEQNIQAQHTVVRVPPKSNKAEEWKQQYQPPQSPSEK